MAELGEIATHTGEPDEAERWFDPCQEVVTDLADDTLQALIFVGRADAARLRREPLLGREHYQSSLQLYQRSEVVRGQARAVIGAAAANVDLGNISTARELLDEARRLVQKAADPAINAASIEQHARLAFADGGEDEGRSLVRQADLVRSRSRRPRGALAERDVQTISVG